jgi:hypothetical protein
MGVLPYCLGKYLGHKWCKVGLQIGRLKVVCEALFKLRAARQQLFFKDQDAPLPVALVDDMESLADLGFVANTTIIVDEVHD